MITTFISITISLIILLIILVRTEEEGLPIIVGIVIVLFGVMGWGVYLSLNGNKYTTSLRKAKIIEVNKGKHITTVVTNDVFTGYESDKIDTNTEFVFKRTIKYNYYNVAISDDEIFLIKSK